MKKTILAALSVLFLASSAFATTYTQDLTASFTSAYTGKTATVQYSVIDAGGTTRIASTGTGIVEETDGLGAATTGTYRVSATLDTAWQYPLRVKWIFTDVSGVMATNNVGGERASLTADGLTPTRIVKLDNADASVSSRMATFTLPTNFSAFSLDSSGRLLLQPTQPGVTIPNVTVTGNVSGDLGGKVIGGGASSFSGNGAQVSATVSGSVTVGGYATGQDPATLLLVTPANKLATNASGKAAATMATGDGADSATALTRLTSTRAGNLDFLTATPPTAAQVAALILTTPANKVATDSSGFVTATNGGSGSAPTVVQIRQEMDTNSTKLANLDAAVSTRLATSGYTAPPTTTQIATALLVTPANKLATDATGQVTATNGGGSGGDQWALPTATTYASTTFGYMFKSLNACIQAVKVQTDLLSFNGGFVASEVKSISLDSLDALAARLLSAPANKILTNSSGQVTATNGGGGGGGGGSITYLLPVGQGHPTTPVYLDAGESSPNLMYIATDSAGRPIPLAASGTVTFTLKSATGTVVYSASPGATIEYSAGGVLVFNWSAAGIPIPAPGRYSGQFKVDGTPFPAGATIPIIVR